MNYYNKYLKYKNKYTNLVAGMHKEGLLSGLEKNNSASLLNFRAGYIDKLPSDFIIPDAGLKIMCSCGDYVHTIPAGDGKLITNVEQFKEYDIFCCLGDNETPKEIDQFDYTSVEENLQYIERYYPNTKLLCIIDITNLEQITNFMNLFKNKCVHIFSHTTHSVVFPPEICIDLLKEGGNVVLHKSQWTTERRGFECLITNYTDISTSRVFNRIEICTKTSSY
jgi:hypothetical protein